VSSAVVVVYVVMMYVTYLNSIHPFFFFFRRETYLHSPSILDSDNQTELSHAFFFGNIRALMLVLIVRAYTL
jgi:hypothetical protein